MATTSNAVSNNQVTVSSTPSTAESIPSSEKNREHQSHPPVNFAGVHAANENNRLVYLDPSVVRVGESFNRNKEAYDSESFDQLTLSILKNRGNLEPITVYEAPDGKFVLVSGERRLQACRVNRLNVYALVIEKPISGEYEIDGLIKNANRESLSPFELGKQILFVLENRKGATLGNLSQQIGIDKSILSRACDLARLPEEVVAAFSAPSDMRFSDGKTIREALSKNSVAVIEEAKLIVGCWRRSNSDHLCRLNFDQGLLPAV